MLALAMVAAALFGGFVATLAQRGIPSAQAQAEAKYAPGRLQLSAAGGCTANGNVSIGAFVLDTQTGELFYKESGRTGDFSKLSTLK
jgi:hypothetical protein